MSEDEKRWQARDAEAAKYVVQVETYLYDTRERDKIIENGKNIPDNFDYYKKIQQIEIQREINKTMQEEKSMRQEMNSNFYNMFNEFDNIKFNIEQKEKAPETRASHPQYIQDFMNELSRLVDAKRIGGSGLKKVEAIVGGWQRGGGVNKENVADALYYTA